MCKFYEEPTIEFHNYGITSNIFTDSTPEQGGNLGDDDIVPTDNPFGN